MIPKIVQVGAGRFGANHLKTLMELDKKNILKLIGVVDLDPKIRRKVRSEYNISVSENLDDFIGDADGFDIVTPPHTHFQIAKYLIKNEKNIFIEKPLTTSSKESEIITTLAKNKKVILQVGHIFRFNPSIIYLKKLLNQKSNYPFLIRVEFLQNRIQSHDTSAIFVFMHGIDVLDYLINKNPKKIFGVRNLSLTKNLDLNSTIILEYDKINAILNVGWIPSGIQRRIEIFSTKRKLVCDLLDNQINIYENNKLMKTVNIKTDKSLLKLELLEFIRCIKNKKTPIVNGIIGSRIVKICEMAILSISEKKQIKIK